MAKNDSTTRQAGVYHANGWSCLVGRLQRPKQFELKKKHQATQSKKDVGQNYRVPNVTLFLKLHTQSKNMQNT